MHLDVSAAVNISLNQLIISVLPINIWACPPHFMRRSGAFELHFVSARYAVWPSATLSPPHARKVNFERKKLPFAYCLFFCTQARSICASVSTGCGTTRLIFPHALRNYSEPFGKRSKSIAGLLCLAILLNGKSSGILLSKKPQFCKKKALPSTPPR